MRGAQAVWEQGRRPCWGASSSESGSTPCSPGKGCRPSTYPRRGDLRDRKGSQSGEEARRLPRDIQEQGTAGGKRQTSQKWEWRGREGRLRALRFCLNPKRKKRRLGVFRQEKWHQEMCALFSDCGRAVTLEAGR